MNNDPRCCNGECYLERVLRRIMSTRVDNSGDVIGCNDDLSPDRHVIVQQDAVCCHGTAVECGESIASCPSLSRVAGHDRSVKRVRWSRENNVHVLVLVIW
jgi:hypothetical protein